MNWMYWMEKSKWTEWTEWKSFGMFMWLWCLLGRGKGALQTLVGRRWSGAAWSQSPVSSSGVVASGGLASQRRPPLLSPPSQAEGCHRPRRAHLSTPLPVEQRENKNTWDSGHIPKTITYVTPPTVNTPLVLNQFLLPPSIPRKNVQNFMELEQRSNDIHTTRARPKSDITT